MSAAIPDKETTRLKAEIERLEAEAAAMRAALETAEWGPQGYCCFCGNHRDDGHRADCSRQLALASDIGRELLERLRRAERALAAVKEIQLASVLGGESSLKGDYNESKL